MVVPPKKVTRTMADPEFPKNFMKIKENLDRERTVSDP